MVHVCLCSSPKSLMHLLSSVSSSSCSAVAMRPYLLLSIPPFICSLNPREPSEQTETSAHCLMGDKTVDGAGLSSNQRKKTRGEKHEKKMNVKFLFGSCINGNNVQCGPALLGVTLLRDHRIDTVLPRVTAFVGNRQTLFAPPRGWVEMRRNTFVPRYKSKEILLK